jgi:hypothetical protein
MWRASGRGRSDESTDDKLRLLVIERGRSLDDWESWIAESATDFTQIKPARCLHGERPREA